MSIIGIDGRVRRVSEEDAKKLVASKRFKYIERPTQDYYPQYDTLRAEGEVAPEVRSSKVLDSDEVLPVTQV